MPSTNKTPNLGLNAWVGTDKPVRDDFNADNQKIDTLAAAIGSPALLAKLPTADAVNWTSENLPQSDSGWIPMILLNGITTESGEYQAAYRKINNIVYLKGRLNGITAKTITAFAVFPLGYRPVSFLVAHANAFVTAFTLGVVTLNQSSGGASLHVETATNLILTGMSYCVN